METDKNTACWWGQLLFNKVLEKQDYSLFVICGIVYMIFFILFLWGTFNDTMVF